MISLREKQNLMMQKKNISIPSVEMKNADIKNLFASGLEYSAPARGAWNIVHTGMLIPESHQIFVCAEGCLRGVVLTAAEMGATDRFSTIAVRDNNILDGDMENLIIDGVTDILNKLNYKPKAVLVYTSCIHHFIACDLKLVYETLKNKFNDIDFIDCYMNPIMRKSGINPDQLMRRQLYKPLTEVEKNKNSVGIIGNDLATDKESELYKIFTDNNIKVYEIIDCKNYNEYLDIAKSNVFISYYNAALTSAKFLGNRLNTETIYTPISFNYDEITNYLNIINKKFNIEEKKYDDYKKLCDNKLDEVKNLIKDIEIAIDYIAFCRPFSLARLLLDKGFNVKYIYTDSVIKEDEEDFAYIKEKYGNVLLYPTVHSSMRFFKKEKNNKTLAIGQKAAYFENTKKFVNIIEGGGLYGFTGILKLCDLMIDAYKNEKEPSEHIQEKGMGGCC